MSALASRSYRRYVFVIAALCSVSEAQAELFHPGTSGCEGCKPDEYLLRISDTVPPGGRYVHMDDPPCANADAVNKQLGAIIATAPSPSQAKEAAGEIGAVAKGLGIYGGMLGKIVSDYADLNQARCHPVCATIPEGAEVTGIAFYMQAWNALNKVKCDIGNQCIAGFSRVFPHVQSKNAICVVVSNWSHDQARPVRMDLWFKSAIQPVEYR